MFTQSRICPCARKKLARLLSGTTPRRARLKSGIRTKILKEREEKRFRVYGDPTHKPVMITECMEFLSPALDDRQRIAVDCTFGGGGHTSAMLDKTCAHIYSVDRDPKAAELAEALPQRLAQAWEEHSEEDLRERFHFVPGKFSNLPKLLKAQNIRPGTVDAILMDLGPSTGQLKEKERGFSFNEDAPLDMRMDVSDRDNPPTGVSRRTAADIVNNCTQRELSYYFKTFSNEKFAPLYAKHIVVAREKEKILTTQQLTSIIYDVTPDAVKLKTKDSQGRKMSLATRVFAALRIVVNNEIGELRDGLYNAAQMLKPGGRLAVLTFHSLETTMTKNFFRGKPLQDPPLFHSEHQVKEAAKKRRRHNRRDARYALPEHDLLFEKFSRKKAGAREVRKNASARSAILFTGTRSDAAITPFHRNN